MGSYVTDTLNQPVVTNQTRSVGSRASPINGGHAAPGADPKPISFPPIHPLLVSPMAKARRPTFAAAERFLGFPRGGSSAVFPAGGGGGGDGDLSEADIWYSEPGRPASDEADDETVTPGVRRAVGGLSRAFGDGRQQVAASSAPVEVRPTWPSPPSAVEPEAAPFVGDESKGWVPPHVYLARRQARASVVEGAGRTLKGRDMSRVRDAVWSRTGFDG
jgi:hypothetical protein